MYVTLISISIIVGYNSLKKEQELQREIDAKNARVQDITKHYSTIVKTNKDTIIYEEDKEIGKISKDTILDLEEITIDDKTTHFNVKNTNYFIKYEDVEKADNVNDKWYKHYVPFNLNVVTNDITNFYKDNKLIYSINKSFDLPIIIKDTDRYYVEFNNDLYYVLKSETKAVKNSNNTNEEVRTSVRTLVYHFVYTDKDSCEGNIYCIKDTLFEQEMKYLHDNEYFTMKLSDLELFLDGKIRIPKKSIVLTMDDGGRVLNAIPILEKYNVQMTLFLITSYFPAEMFESKNLDIHSHTHNMHEYVKYQNGGEGGAINTWSYNKVMTDLLKSRELLNGSKYFAYPFYSYSTRSISMLKEAGFKMAFVGSHGTYGVSTPYTNRYLIPREPIYGNTSFEKFKSYL